MQNERNADAVKRIRKRIERGKQIQCVLIMSITVIMVGFLWQSRRFIINKMQENELNILIRHSIIDALPMGSSFDPSSTFSYVQVVRMLKSMNRRTEGIILERIISFYQDTLKING